MALGHRYDCKYPYFLLYIGFFLVKSGGLQSVQHGEQNNVGPSYPIRVLYSRSCTGSDPAPAFGPDEERTVYVRDNGTYWEVGGSVIGLFIVHFQWKRLELKFYGASPLQDQVRNSPAEETLNLWLLRWKWTIIQFSSITMAIHVLLMILEELLRWRSFACGHVSRTGTIM